MMRRITLAKNTNSLAHVQKIPFPQMPRWVSFENKEQMTWKKLVITLICRLKLNRSVNWVSFDINCHFSYHFVSCCKLQMHTDCGS